jgi:transposase-like protein
MGVGETMTGCPHCGEPMHREFTSKTIKAIEYYCSHCGQNFTKVKGEKGYHKGQVINLPQEYWGNKK